MHNKQQLPPPAQKDGAAIDASPDRDMDTADKKILSLIQSGFPLSPRPYAVIGDALGISEEAALEKVRSLRTRGIIRRIGANFQSSRLGFRSTLCAAKVPAQTLEAFIQAVNARPGVTHNYLRDHTFNVWFTLIGPSDNAIAEEISALSAATGVDILNLPARRLYKIKVDFSFSDVAPR